VTLTAPSTACSPASLSRPDSIGSSTSHVVTCTAPSSQVSCQSARRSIGLRKNCIFLFVNNSLFVADSSIAVKTGGCFPGTSYVTVEGRGRVPLTSVKVGERVLASNSEGHVTYSDVMLFLHHDTTAIGSFYSLQADSGHVIQLTANHLIYRSRCRTNHTTNNFASCAEAVFADDVRVGDTLFHVASDKKYVVTSRVVSITVERIAGMYAPLTSAGNVVVDDVIVSCYATVASQSVAHASFAPLRLWRAAKALLTGDLGHGVPTSSEDSDWYVHLLAKVGQLLLPSSIWFGSKPLG
jgi:hypothetical protein